MNKKSFIQQTLNDHFPDPSPSLVFEDNYTLLIAVLLSAQCTDERVNQVTPILFERAKTPEKMVEVSQEELEKLIFSTGFFRAKAKAIRALSEILIRKHKGKVPRTLKALEALPGVGHKTASVVLNQGYGKAAFPVDTHVHRLAERWGLSSGKDVETTEKDLKKYFPKKLWGKIHLQMVLFGRAYCKARGHFLEKCPICSKLQT